jgi:hypothetical protein
VQPRQKIDLHACEKPTEHKAALITTLVSNKLAEADKRTNQQWQKPPAQL